VARPRKKLTAATQARLNEDLALQRAGRDPIFYRKVPGQKYRYYDPKRPERAEVTQDYVVRVYKKAISDIDRLRVTEAVKFNVRTQARQRRALADTWAYRQRYENGVIYTAAQASREAEFIQLYQQFRETAYLARKNNQLEVPDRGLMFETGSEYSNLLVALGRRTGLEDFPIGESPLHVTAGTSYIDTVVKPYLAGETNVLANQQEVADLSGTGETVPTEEERVAEHERNVAKAQAEKAEAVAMERKHNMRVKQAQRRGDYDYVDEEYEAWFNSRG
jgi:hypothetical protein